MAKLRLSELVVLDTLSFSFLLLELLVAVLASDRLNLSTPHMHISYGMSSDHSKPESRCRASCNQALSPRGVGNAALAASSIQRL